LCVKRHVGEACQKGNRPAQHGTGWMIGRNLAVLRQKKRHEANALCLIFLGGATGDRTPNLMTARLKKENEFQLFQ